MALLQKNSIPLPTELAVKLREHLKTRASDGAAFLQQLHHWSEKEEGFLHQGFRWIWNTYSGWLDNFKWWTDYDFRVIVKKLRELGLIVFEQLKDFGRDRTGCYRLNYEHEWLAELPKAAPSHHPSNSSTDAQVKQSTAATDDCSTDITKTTSKDNYTYSLPEEERENFEKFVREEWQKLTAKNGERGEDIVSMSRFLRRKEDFDNWYQRFLSSAAGRKSKQEAAARAYDWRNDPRFEEWIHLAFHRGFDWADENPAQKAERTNFINWAIEVKAYEGVCDGIA